jgi:hypothetical protein
MELELCWPEIDASAVRAEICNRVVEWVALLQGGPNEIK